MDISQIIDTIAKASSYSVPVYVDSNKVKAVFQMGHELNMVLSEYPAHHGYHPSFVLWVTHTLDKVTLSSWQVDAESHDSKLDEIVKHVQEASELSAETAKSQS